MRDESDPAATPRATPHRVGVAAFDVDGTLTERDCVVPFLRSVAGTLALAVGLAGRAPRLVPALVRRDRDEVKAIASAAVFAGRPASEVAARGRSFAGRVFESRIRPRPLALLRGHQARGHDVVLVSASYAAYLGPLGDRLGVTAVLATELALDDAAVCTGELDGGNCRGDEKVSRLHAWLEQRHGGRHRVELWAYGDSAGDLAMLRDADHAVWLGARRSCPAGMTTT